MKRELMPIVALGAMLVMGTISRADEPQREKAPPRPVELADGKIKLMAPGEWKAVEPRVRIIEHEFALPGKEKDDVPGRLTIMIAGGSVEDNIDRWLGQFVQPDRTDTKERARVEEDKIEGMAVHWVDVAGTFKDQAGPFAPAVEREKYRMLAAIIELGDGRRGNYFIKLTGPEGTLGFQEENFRAFVKSIRGGN